MVMIPFAMVRAEDPAFPPLADGRIVEEFYCGDPRCDCVTGHLFVGGTGFAVDVGTGRLDPLSALSDKTLPTTLAGLLRQGDTLGKLREHYHTTQQYGWEHHWEFIDWTQVRPGEYVRWSEVVLRSEVQMLPVYAEPKSEIKPDTKPAYHLGFADAYCVDSKCDCKQVVWTVAAALPGDADKGHVRTLGQVRFDFRKQEPGVLQASPGLDPNQILLLVLQLLQRYPNLPKEYEGRYERIRKMIIPLATKQRTLKQQEQKDALAQVGRNDACPCGSGKKYKKCHGPRVEAQRAKR